MPFEQVGFVLTGVGYPYRLGARFLNLDCLFNGWALSFQAWALGYAYNFLISSHFSVRACVYIKLVNFLSYLRDSVEYKITLVKVFYLNK